jgi:hypothetical protein
MQQTPIFTISIKQCKKKIPFYTMRPSLFGYHCNSLTFVAEFYYASTEHLAFHSTIVCLQEIISMVKEKKKRLQGSKNQELPELNAET